MDDRNETAMVVGASRGLGLGLVRELAGRGWGVTGTERAARPSAELHALAKDSDGRVKIETADVTSAEDIARLARALDGRSLDVLFVNAGMLDSRTTPISQVTDDVWAQVMDTNALAPMRVIAAIEGHLARDATIAVMSSGLASIANNTAGGYEAYRASKAALNMMMRSYAVRAGGKRTILCVAPGWVRTDMGGSDAALDIETSVKGMVDMIERRRGRGGVAFVDYRDVELPW